MPILPVREIHNAALKGDTETIQKCVENLREQRAKQNPKFSEEEVGKQVAELISAPSKHVANTTPLMAAAQNGHTEAVELLLSLGANATVKELKMGATAMHYAAAGKNPDTYAAFLRHNPELAKITDKEGRTPASVFASVHGGNRLAPAQQILKNGKGGLRNGGHQNGVN